MDHPPVTKHILMVGSTCVDVVAVCPNYPEEDTDTRATDQEMRRGGNSSNSSSGIASLIHWRKNKFGKGDDLKVSFFGTIGDDVGSTFMMDDMKKRGICVDNVVQIANAPSPLSVILVNTKDHTRTIIHSQKDLPELENHHFSGLDTSLYSWIHLESRKNVPQIIQFIKDIRAREKGSSSSRRVPISIEFEKPLESRALLWHQEIDVIFVSKDWAKAQGATSLDNALDTFINLVPTTMPHPTVIVVPWGEVGCRAFTIHGGKLISTYSASAYPPKAMKDTNGAGDSYIGAFIFYQLAMRKESEQISDLEETIKFSSRFAGAKCGTNGFNGMNNWEQFVD